MMVSEKNEKETVHGNWESQSEQILTVSVLSSMHLKRENVPTPSIIIIHNYTRERINIKYHSEN